MKVYVVTTGAYSDYEIDSVFIDKHKAEIYCALCNKGKVNNYGSYQVEEYESDDNDIEGEIEIAWRYEIMEDDRATYGTIVPYTPKCLNEVKELFFRRGTYEAIVYLRSENNSKALKIARDMFAQYRAEKEGL